MTKKKTNYALWTVICLVSILAVGTVAIIAFSGSATTIIENAGGVTINNPTQPAEIAAKPNFVLGSVSSQDIESQYISINGDVEYHITGSFTDASTTIVSFPSPFLRATSSVSDIVIDGTTESGYGYTSATTTVDMVRLDIRTAATSSYAVSCGASTRGGTAPTLELLATSDVAVSTYSGLIATSSTGILENQLTAALGGIANDAGDVEKITLGGTYPYFVCQIDSYYEGAFTEVTNTFDGVFTVVLHKQR